MQPQPQPQPLAMPQPIAARNGMLWGRAIRPTNPHIVRLGDHWVNAGDLLRQRFTTAADIITQDLLARGDKALDPGWINKHRIVRGIPGM